MNQHGREQGTGSAVRGEVVPDESQAEQTKPTTRFQKVAPALRGDQDQDQDQAETEPAADPNGTAVMRPDGLGTDAAADAELRPGEAKNALGDFSDVTYGNLIPEATEFREQWQQIQFKFVDDPQGSVTDAADVVAQVTARLEAAIQERQRIIAERQRSLRGRWAEGSNADTETLRQTLRMYRAFLDQLLGSRARVGLADAGRPE